MPKPNKTMLDRLAETFKSMGNKKPEIIQETTIRDPLGYNMVQRRFGVETSKMPSMTPERQMYQKGLDVQYNNRLNKFDEDLNDAEYNLERLTEQYGDDFAEAQDALADDMSDWARNQLSYEYTDPAYVEDVVRNEMPRYKLSDYWEGEYSLPEYQERFDDFNEARDAAEEAFSDWQRYGRQRLQRQTPRYRNYQRAMMQREENARVGRINAAIMNLYRRGYSMPEIRAMLNGTIPTPAVGGR